MVASKVFLTHARPLQGTAEQSFRTFLEAHYPATVGFVRSGDGGLTVINAKTPAQAKQVADALATNPLGTEALAVVLGDSPRGQRLDQLYTELKQLELENNWTNRQW